MKRLTKETKTNPWHSVKGKGVSFAENDPIWHYRTLTDELYTQAVTELKKSI